MDSHSSSIEIDLKYNHNYDVERSIGEIASICSTYFCVDREIVQRTLLRESSNVIDAFLRSDCDDKIIVLTLDNSDGINSTHASQKRVSVHVGWNGDFMKFKSFVAFIRVKSSENTNFNLNLNRDKKASDTFLFPFVWNKDLCPHEVSHLYIKEIFTHMMEYELFLCTHDDSRRYKLNCILQKLQEISNLFQQLVSKSSIRHANFVIGNTLKNLFDTCTNDLIDYRIKLAEEAELEDIKFNVAEWSVEIVRILGEYSAKVDEEFIADFSEELASAASFSECSDTDHSSYSTSNLNSFSESSFDDYQIDTNTEESDNTQTCEFLERKQSQIDPVSDFSGDVTDPYAEIQFWISYEDTLKDLYKQLESKTVVNTLNMLEFNGVCVDNIYCFKDAIVSTEEIIKGTENINILMRGFPLEDLKYTDSISSLKEVIERILNHFKKSRLVRAYTNKLFTDFISGISIEVINSITRVISLELKNSEYECGEYMVIKHALGVVCNWLSRLDHFGQYLESTEGCTLSFSLSKVLFILNPFKDLLSTIEYCRKRFKTVCEEGASFIRSGGVINCALETAHLLKFDDLCQEDDILGEITTYVALLKEAHRNFVENLLNEFSVWPPINVNSVLPFIHKFSDDLDKVENSIVRAFKKRLDDCIDVNERVAVIVDANKISTLKKASELTSDIDSIADELYIEYEKILMEFEADKADSSVHCYFPFSIFSSDFLFSMNLQGKATAILKAIDCLMAFITHEKLKYLRTQVLEFKDKLHKLYSNVGDISDLYLKKRVLNIEKSCNDGRLSISANLPFINKNDIEELIHKIYGDCTRSTNDSVIDITLEEILNITIVLHHILRVCDYSEFVRCESISNEADSINFKWIFLLANEAYEPVKCAISEGYNSSWEDFISFDKIYSFFVAFHGLFRVESFIRNVMQRFNKIRAYVCDTDKKSFLDTLLSCVSYSVQYAAPKETKMAEFIRKELCDAIEVSLRLWAKNKISYWKLSFLNGSLETFDFLVMVTSVGNTQLEPSVPTLRRRFYSHLYNSIEITNLFSDEIMGTLCKDANIINFLSAGTIENINAIECLLSDLELELRFWRRLTSDWIEYVTAEILKRKDFLSVISEVECMVNGAMAIDPLKKIGSIALKIPKDAYINILRKFKLKVFGEICEATMNSAKTLFDSLRKYSESMQMDQLIKSTSMSVNSLDSVSSSSRNTLVAEPHNKSSFSITKLLSLDNSTIDKCAKLLIMGSNDENDNCIVIDSISIDIHCFMDIYIKSISDYVGAGSAILNNFEKWKSLTDEIKYIERALSGCGYSFPKSWIGHSSLNRLMDKLVRASKEFMTKENIEPLNAAMIKLEDVFVSRQKILAMEWEKMASFIGIEMDFDDTLKVLSDFELRYKMVHEHILNIRQISAALSEESAPDLDTIGSIPDYPVYEVLQEVTSYKLEWIKSKAGLLSYQSLMSLDISKASLYEIEKYLLEFKNTIDNSEIISSLMSDDFNQLYALFKGEFGSYFSEEQLIAKLKMLLTSNADSININNKSLLCISNLLKLQKLAPKKLNEIVQSVKCEVSIRIYINELRDNWSQKQMKWSGTPICYDKAKTGKEVLQFFSLSNLNELLYFIDDGMASLYTVRRVANAGSSMQDDIELWLMRLMKAKSFLNQWRELEDATSYLSNIFSSYEVRMQLARCFTTFLQLLTEFIPNITSISSIKCIVGEDYKIQLEKAKEVIHNIEYQLKAFLDNQRYAFPRFFFLGDEDLFRIVGRANVKDMQDRIFKMFPGVMNFKYDQQNNICGLISKEGECIDFDENIDCNDIQCVHLLKKVEIYMKTKLKKLLKECNDRFKLFYGSLGSNFQENFVDLIESFPSQILVISLFLLWTERMETIKSDAEINSLQLFLSSLINFIVDRLNMDSHITTSKFQHMAAYLIYQLDKTKLVGLVSQDSFEWLRCIRYYMDKNGNELELRIGCKKYAYGFEYFGIGQKLIITELTEKCFIAMSESLDLQLVGNPQGPAGTGKTESIKALADLCGYIVLVFNCNDSFESNDMGKIFSGLCQLGAWGVFDEFNRLKEGVLSAITEQIQHINNSMNKGMERINILDKDVYVNKSTAIFVTMNPGYTGRSVFPLNTRLLCRPCAMERVDLLQIAKVNLTLSAFSDQSDTSAKQICTLLHTCSEIFTEDYYDFGLRCMKLVLNCIRYFTKSSSSASSIGGENTDTRIKKILMKECAHRVIDPRIPEEQKDTFKCIIQQCLTADDEGLTSHYPHISGLEDKFLRLSKDVFEAKKIFKTDILTRKAFEIYMLHYISMGLILFGPAGSGKSLCLEVAVEVMQRMFNSTYEIIRFDPMSLASNELYGYFCNGEWKDGLLSSTIRMYSQTNVQIFIVFDNNINSEWIENINSVLDDNMVLTLPNGDRVYLTKNIHIILETDTLEHMTPATISRCGLIQFESIFVSEAILECYSEYFDFLSPDVKLQQLKLFNLLMKNIAKKEEFIFSFINGFGAHLNGNELQNFIDKTKALANAYNAEYEKIEMMYLERFSTPKNLLTTSVLIKNSQLSFIIKGKRGSGKAWIMNQIIKLLPDVRMEVIYLSKGCDFSIIFDLLYKNCTIEVINERNVMSPKDNGKKVKLVILLKDLQYLYTHTHKNNYVISLLRQIAEYKYFYRLYKSQWQKVYLENVQFVLQINDGDKCELPLRFKRQFPAVYIQKYPEDDEKDFISRAFDEIETIGSYCMKEPIENITRLFFSLYIKLSRDFDGYFRHSVNLTYHDLVILQGLFLQKNFSEFRNWICRSLLKTRCERAKLNEYIYPLIEESINIDKFNDYELFNIGEYGAGELFITNAIAECIKQIHCFLLVPTEGFHLSITGQACTGKSTLCELISNKLGYNFVSIGTENVTDKLLEIVKTAGTNLAKICVYIDWDFLLLQSPFVLCSLKNLILIKNFSILLKGDALKEVYKHQTTVEAKSYDQFEEKFYQNVIMNLKFIISSKLEEFDMSILTRGFCCKLPTLTTENMKEFATIILKNAISSCCNGETEIFEVINDIMIETFSNYIQYVGENEVSQLSFIFYGRIFRDVLQSNIKKSDGELNHLKSGVNKIETAKRQVYSLGQLLDRRKEQLALKNVEAEEKVKLIVSKQVESEKNRQAAKELTVQLEREKMILEERTNEINKQLEEVVPLLRQAKEEVEGISRKGLDELRSMANPPSVVKYTIETVAMLLENFTDQNITWDEARKIFKSPDFISKILSFNAEQVSKVTFGIIQQRTASNTHWDVVRICKASKAAGPLAKWVNSLLACSEISIKMDPLLKEIDEVKSCHLENEEKLQMQNTLIDKLENDLAQYKIEYSQLIAESGLIKSEIENIEEKITKSKTMLEELSQELERWKVSIDRLQNNKNVLIGNCILNATVAALFSSLECSQRNRLYESISTLIKKKNIKSDFEISKILNMDRYLIEENIKYRHCLIVDASQFVYEGLVRGDSKTVISACDPHFLTVLQSVKQYQGEIFVNDIHLCELRVKIAILKEFIYKINEGNRSQDVESKEGFHIYLMCSTDDLLQCFKLDCKNDYILYKIYKRAFVLCLKLSKNYFESFCIQEVMEDTEYELFISNEKTEIRLEELKKCIRSNEECLLEFLLKKNDILDQESLQYLENYNKRRMEFEFGIAECIETQDEFKRVVNLKNDYIALMCQVYDVLTKIEHLDPFYVFDSRLTFYAMRISIKEKDKKRAFVKIIYKWIEQSLFIKDKLYWELSILDIYANNVDDGNKDEILRLLNDFIVCDLNKMDKCAKLMEDIQHAITVNLLQDETRKNVQDGKDVNQIDKMPARYNSDVFDYYKLIIILTQGFEDPTVFVECYAENSGKNLKKFAIGSISELDAIEEGIRKSFESDKVWVLLKNVHIAPSWFKYFESQFVNTIPNGSKLFVTWDSRMPMAPSILMKWGKIIYQEPKNLKSLLVHLYKQNKLKFLNAGNLKSHLLFKTLLVHAIVFCRQLYIPYGWTEQLDFDDNDIKISMKTTIEFCNDLGIDKDMAEYDWKKIYPNSDLLTDWCRRICSVYASKITQEMDYSILKDILKFSDPGIYPLGFPEDNLESWLNKIPHLTTPSMLGLNDSVQHNELKENFLRTRPLFSSSNVSTPDKVTDEDVDEDDIAPQLDISKIANRIFKACMEKELSGCSNTKSYKLREKDCKKLVEFVNCNKLVCINLDRFLEPKRLLDCLKFPLSTINNCEAVDLSLCATISLDCPTGDDELELFKMVDKLDKEKYINNTSIKSRLILKDLVLCGAIYNIAENTIITSDCSDRKTEQRVSVVLYWSVGHEPSGSKSAISLPLYSSRGKLIYQIPLAVETVRDQLYHLKNVKFEPYRSLNEF